VTDRVLMALSEMGSERPWKLRMQLAMPCLVMMNAVELEQEK
jgi:hypothetical protein